MARHQNNSVQLELFRVPHTAGLSVGWWNACWLASNRIELKLERDFCRGVLDLRNRNSMFLRRNQIWRRKEDTFTWSLSNGWPSRRTMKRKYSPTTQARAPFQQTNNNDFKMILSPSSFRVVAILAATISCAHAFSLDNSRGAKHVRAICQQVSRTRCHKTISQQPFNSRILLKAAESEQTDDDGWGDSMSTTTAAEASSDRISKSQELANLQNDIAMKQQNRGTMRSSSAGINEEKERDLFIPIFTLVSVIGFTSLYGYEMLRLYSRGELYLPWN